MRARVCARVCVLVYGCVCVCVCVCKFLLVAGARNAYSQSSTMLCKSVGLALRMLTYHAVHVCLAVVQWLRVYAWSGISPGTETDHHRRLASLGSARLASKCLS